MKRNNNLRSIPAHPSSTPSESARGPPSSNLARSAHNPGHPDRPSTPPKRRNIPSDLNEPPEPDRAFQGRGYRARCWWSEWKGPRKCWRRLGKRRAPQRSRTPQRMNPASLPRSRRSRGGGGTRFGWINLDLPGFTLNAQRGCEIPAAARKETSKPNPKTTEPHETNYHEPRFGWITLDLPIGCCPGGEAGIPPAKPTSER